MLEKTLESLVLQRRSNQSILKEISPECSLEGLMLKLKPILWPPDVKKESEVVQLCLTLCDPMDCSLPGCSVHGIFQARGDLPDPGIEPRPPALQADSLLSEPPGKPLSSPKQVSESHSVVSDSLRPRGLYSPWNSLGQNTGMGCLSLLQGIFPTQESNWGLLRCRGILYQLSYQGSQLGGEQYNYNDPHKSVAGGPASEREDGSRGQRTERR